MRNTLASAVLLIFAISIAGCGHGSNVSTRSGSSAGTGAVLVPAGTTFYGKLQQPINTKTSHDGDTFTIVQTDTFLHKNPALHGSAIDGHLENVRSAGPMRKPALTLVFDDIRMADGTKAPVDVRLESMKAFAAKSHHLRTLGMMVGGAVAGHEVAKRTGKRHGGLMGAVGGYVVSQQLKTDINVPAGTVLQVRFVQPARAGG